MTTFLPTQTVPPLLRRTDSAGPWPNSCFDWIFFARGIVKSISIYNTLEFHGTKVGRQTKLAEAVIAKLSSNWQFKFKLS